MVKEPKQEQDITWAWMLQTEPRLRSLLQRAREARVGRDEGFDSMQFYNLDLKPQIEQLVGWGASTYAHPMLRTATAFEIASREITKVLR
jgi:hypothetical protein